MKKVTAVIINCTLFLSGMILLGTTILVTYIYYNISRLVNVRAYNFFEVLKEGNFVGLFIFALTLTVAGFIMAVINHCKADK